MKPAEIKEIMTLMKYYKVTSLKLNGLEMVMPLEHTPAEAPDDTMSDDDLLFYSS